MSRLKNTALIGAGIIVALLLGIQLIPYGRQHTNPPVIQEPDWNSDQTRQLVQRACFDCHSNETYWPWYSNIAPMSFLIQRDVDEGRAVLNFSEWEPGPRPTIEIERMTEVITTDQMPPGYYLILNPDSRISQVEEPEMIQGLIATMSLETQ